MCDFTNTNNNDFISTPIAALTDAESCEINAALLNLVMKDLFSGLPSEEIIMLKFQNHKAPNVAFDLF